jgi:hypothetical protein
MPVPAYMALISAAIIMGISLYISLVEQPSRAALADAPMLGHWKASFKFSGRLQPAIALFGGVAAIIAWSLLDNAYWLLGSAALLATWPYTMMLVLPPSRELSHVPMEEAGPDTTRQLRYLARLHHIRSASGFTATLAFAHAMRI